MKIFLKRLVFLMLHIVPPGEEAEPLKEIDKSTKVVVPLKKKDELIKKIEFNSGDKNKFPPGNDDVYSMLKEQERVTINQYLMNTEQMMGLLDRKKEKVDSLKAKYSDEPGSVEIERLKEKNSSDPNWTSLLTLKERHVGKTEKEKMIEDLLLSLEWERKMSSYWLNYRRREYEEQIRKDKKLLDWAQSILDKTKHQILVLDYIDPFNEFKKDIAESFHHIIRTNRTMRETVSLVQRNILLLKIERALEWFLPHLSEEEVSALSEEGKKRYLGFEEYKSFTLKSTKNYLDSCAAFAFKNDFFFSFRVKMKIKINPNHSEKEYNYVEEPEVRTSFLDQTGLNFPHKADKYLKKWEAQKKKEARHNAKWRILTIPKCLMWLSKKTGWGLSETERTDWFLWKKFSKQKDKVADSMTQTMKKFRKNKYSEKREKLAFKVVCVFYNGKMHIVVLVDPVQQGHHDRIHEALGDSAVEKTIAKLCGHEFIDRLPEHCTYDNKPNDFNKSRRKEAREELWFGRIGVGERFYYLKKNVTSMGEVGKDPNFFYNLALSIERNLEIVRLEILKQMKRRIRYYSKQYLIKHPEEAKFMTTPEFMGLSKKRKEELKEKARRVSMTELEGMYRYASVEERNRMHSLTLFKQRELARKLELGLSYPEQRKYLYELKRETRRVYAFILNECYEIREINIPTMKQEFLFNNIPVSKMINYVLERKREVLYKEKRKSKALEDKKTTENSKQPKVKHNH